LEKQLLGSTTNTRPTVIAQPTRPDFTGQDIFIGLDVHLKSWTVSIYTRLFEHKTFRQNPRTEDLLRYLHGQFPSAQFHCVYEAGYSGFWIHQQLTAAGVDVIVINPADVPTTDKERTYKDDPVDARKLARSLRAGELRGIYVPSRMVLEDRSLVRTRQSLVRKQTRVKNQIKSLLRFYGVEFPDGLGHWSAVFIRWVTTLTHSGECEYAMYQESGAIALRLHLDELTQRRQQILEVTRAVRRLAFTDHYRQNVENLVTLHGIGTLTAMVLLTEIVDIGRFRSLDRLASFVGLVPSSHSSGEKDRRESITPRRSAHLRYVIIESAWVAARKDPQLMLDFLNLAKRMKKTDAIIRIARKQLNRIRFVLKNETPYVQLPLAA
jgi:transposase